MNCKIRLFLIASLVLLSTTYSQNYDESKVPNYTLPDLMVLENGGKVTSTQEWIEKRRPEILNLFSEVVYGKNPGLPDKLEYVIGSIDSFALNGIAIRKEVEIKITNQNNNLSLDLLLYLPKNEKTAHPVFLGLNFYGNQTVNSDPGITLPKSWVRNNKDFGITDNVATEASRGVRSSRWEVEYLIGRGYGLAVIYYGDIDPDYHDEFQNGVHQLFKKKEESKQKPNEWGSISAWAWGLSRTMDYLETDTSIDNNKVAVFGHSRLGKTSLWAGAQDERFAIVISNNSGCGGAALSKRRFGETVKKINDSFPHWFCDNFKKYNDKEDDLPIDQHMLVALAAPRPVYVASAKDDRWADPHGEFLSAKNAEPVYKIFGLNGLQSENMPGVDDPVGEEIGYHIRTGGHGVTLYDWEQYTNFADKHFSGNNN